MSTLIKNDCGKHWGRGGKCSKCAYFGELNAKPEYRAGLQYTGTPFIACLETEAQAADRRIDESAARYRAGIF
jgi:hypothetical protein